MSRVPAAGGDVVVRKPQNNIYTVLTLIATVVTVLGLVVLFTQAGDMGVNFFGG